MRLILSRHGNTFGPGDPVVWTGSTNDLPLVAAGLEQAERLAQVLKDAAIDPVAVYCGPLQRTRVYAQIIIDRLKLQCEPIIDLRLNEIDYGQWTGLTNAEVTARYGDAEMKSWDKQSKWPANAGWTGTENEVIADVQSFAGELVQRYGADDVVLVISSNGRLRYFLTLIPGELERRIKQGAFKVKTGNICGFTQADNGWSCEYWDQVPAAAHLSPAQQLS